MNVSELRDLWSRESEYYKKSEVGSGVQRFVWDVLQSSDLLNLRKGLKSTSAHRRSREFLLEESNKGGQADAVIFIDRDVVIPLEVERFENARGGEWQILKYRTAFEQKYGILTDGYEWRFYYGTIADEKFYKTTIDDMLDGPERFRTFWDDYVKPQNYYLSFFEEEGQQTLPLFTKQLLVDAHRDRFFEDVTAIIRKLKDKLLNAGYFRGIADSRARERKSTETAYSYLIQFILYKTLVDNGFAEFRAEFARKCGAIHQYLKNQSFNGILMILEGLSDTISKNIYKPFDAEQVLVLEQVKKLVFAGEDELINVAPFLDIFVFVKKFDFANVQNDVFGTVYETYLKELFEDSNLGQYYTDPAVVDFMLQEVGYTAATIRERGHHDLSIVDPACGSGTFLYSAVREIVAAGSYTTQVGSAAIEAEVLDNVFGLEIAEFPLYLAEMSIIMRMLPAIISSQYNNPIEKKLKLFLTEDSIAELLDSVGGRIAAEDAPGQIRLPLAWEYDGFMRDERDLDEMKNSLNTLGGGAGVVGRRRFDFVVANPPYIGYNEASRMGVKAFGLMKRGALHLNDVYGWNLHSTPKKRKKYPPKPNLYAFFLALSVSRC